jgi:hypothetical protein
MSHLDVETMFARCGDIITSRLLYDQTTGRQ